MSATWAVALTLVVALLVAVLVFALAKTQHRTSTPRHAVPLRAEDAADHITPRLGDDDQFRRWRTLVPHIRREANAERDATTASEED